MAYKRSRSSFEADLQAKASPFVVYGTPLPPLDSEARDDGSYVPIWKQEVTDERGRKRLHGAFTGGFSAGYFNTVGSKEGWTPSTFVSSRANRRKDDPKISQQRPEDFMDEEDLAEAAESQSLQTNQAFAGLGATADDPKHKPLLMDLFRAPGETMGVKLLRKMGWRDGQGIGPKQRRKARLTDTNDPDAGDADEHMFAPEDSEMITFSKKTDRKGLGFEGETSIQPGLTTDDQKEDDDLAPGPGKQTPKTTAKRSGMGTGVLNDTGSDDEDPFEIGPKISYNRVIGGNKKKQKSKPQNTKQSVQTANPLLGTKPVFRSKNATSTAFRKCHDGRLPIDGFVLAEALEASLYIEMQERFPRPKAPEGWKSSKAPQENSAQGSRAYQSTAEAARASELNPRSRAELLGEDQLPGKSVFDYLSSTARDRIAAATGRTNLPQALNEATSMPKKSSTGSSSIVGTVENASGSQPDIPNLPKETALAALGRGTAGWTPYASDPQKSGRYRSFLEFMAGLRGEPPVQPTDLKADAWNQELREFAHAAEVFKPMTGLMASRFTSSATAPKSSSGEAEDERLLRDRMDDQSSKPKDPAEEAAKMGMFGPMTRIVKTFYPTRLVCKRFGVRPPAHVVDESSTHAGKSDSSAAGVSAGMGASNPPITPSYGAAGPDVRSSRAPDLVSKHDIERMMKESGRHFEDIASVSGSAAAPGIQTDKPATAKETVIDIERNEALEAQKAGDDLFKSIFGDDSD